MCERKPVSLIVLIGIWASAGVLQGADSFPLNQVKLLDGPFKHAQDLNLDHLLKYDVDRLLAPYRKEAGLVPKAASYPNWMGLDGHVGGHYLSAMALYVAATGNGECKRRMDYMVDELKCCQTAHSDGYVGAVPDGREIWRLVAAGHPKATRKGWVPWYNLHKTYAGLRDAWIYGKSSKAKAILIRFADWCDQLLAGYSAEQMEIMMGQEHGGMNELLADVSLVTGDRKYLELAKRFSHRQLLAPMAEGRDTLDDKHANTQVPKAVGFQRIAELSGDKMYHDAAAFFWQTIVNHRTLAFGGNSRREHFPAAPACIEGHIAHGELLPLTEAPVLVGDASSIPSHVIPVEGAAGLRFKIEMLIQPAAFKDIVLEPFYRIHDSRYMMYWRVTK